MKEYPKIETLLDRDEQFKVVEGEWRLPEFEYLRDNDWLFTEKIDGTNIRVKWIEGTVEFAGRTDDAQIPPFVMTMLDAMFPVALLRHIFGSKDACLYGEAYGNKIQSGRKYVDGGDSCDFALLDVKIDTWWLKFVAVDEIACKLRLMHAPVIEQGCLSKAIALVREGVPSVFGDFMAEGLVVRPRVDLFARDGSRIVGKIKTKDFRR